MKLTRHGDHLVQLTRFPRIFPVNCYLVREDDGFTLIDATLPRSTRGILAAARDLGAPIVRIALTHAHGDHIGSLDAVVGRLPAVEVAISRRDARLLRKDRTPDPGEPADARLRGGYPGATTRPTRLLDAGDHVGSLEVIAAPGHTPGQVAFLDVRDGTLLAGDAYATLGGVATTATVNPRFPLPALATWHRPTALDTARRLRALDPSRLAVGHGPVIDAPAGAMDRAIARSTRG